MSIRNPQQLVDEFKKSGEFDRLRREMLTQFKNSDSINSILPRVRDIVRQKLEKDRKPLLLSSDAMYGELMQEMERYPLVERAIADFPALHGPKSEVRTSVMDALTKLLHANMSREDDKTVPTTNGTVDAGIDEDMQQSDEEEPKTRLKA